MVPWRTWRPWLARKFARQYIFVVLDGTPNPPLW
jgi:hypothetical protein